jgi:hypothetical protein
MLQKNETCFQDIAVLEPKWKLKTCLAKRCVLVSAQYSGLAEKTFPIVVPVDSSLFVCCSVELAREDFQI